jgi:hypothetical protein
VNEKYNVGPQYANCYCHNGLLLVPNGETNGVNECLIHEERIGSENRTYLRSTIKREEVAMDRYPKNLRPENSRSARHYSP